MNFIHLRNRTNYSLLESSNKISDLAEACAKFNMPALAITDNNNLFASLEFSKEMSYKGIQPIVGVDLNFVYDKKSTNITKLLALAKDDEGYQNILKLNSFCYTTDQNFITFEELKLYHQGLILIVGSHYDYLGKLLLNSDLESAEKYLIELKSLIGDCLYIELMRHGLEDEQKLEQLLIDLAIKHNIPLVATNDVYFLDKGKYEAHTALLCIKDGAYLGDNSTNHKITEEHYLKSPEEMIKIFSDIPEACQNTVNIAKRCYVMASERAPMLPNFTVEEGLSEEDSLRKQAEEGLRQRLINAKERGESLDEEVYFARLNFELNVIINMKFPGYFLIISDFIKWSKKNNIPVGPGRGSGAGSIVAYALEITDLDPIRFGLLFERFLNPERISMPDFDIDFCQNRRDEVINYVQNKYGKDKVAQIITFGKLQAKAVVRDVGRVMQLPYSQVDRISKMIPFNAVNPVTLSQAIEIEPMLKEAKEEDESIAKLLEIALQLEGLSRHASTHAAGIVIAGKPLVELVPLYRDPKSDFIVVQYSMKYAESSGLVKFDFLGLKTLTVISDTIKIIKETEKKEIDITSISLKDEKTYKLLSKGEAVGVFQFESAGMMDSLRKLKPDSIEDLIALGALYRPGPMDNIPTYIACKHGHQKPDYIHPKLEAVLKETFGVIIYQEQVMEIAKVLAGYSLGAADLLRRAMGKKIKAEMDAQREMFVTGAIANGVDADQASFIFDLVAKFAGYGFNKSHAAAYALISYQTAYLKANYIEEFLVASMNLEIDDTDKINMFIQEAKNFDIEILPPSINYSDGYFKIEKINGVKKIRYALGAIKNVGLEAMNELINERKNGIYTDIFNLSERLGTKVINKRQLESLIKAGCFDEIHSNRHQLFKSVDIIVKHSSSHNQDLQTNQISLFGNTSFAKEIKKLDPCLEGEWIDSEKLAFEAEAIGFYLSGHPLDNFEKYLRNNGILKYRDLKDVLEIGSSEVRLAGVIISNKVRSSARGRFISVNLSDSSSIYQVSIYDDKIVAKANDLISNKELVIMTLDARKDEEGGIRLTVKSIISLDEFLVQKPRNIQIIVDKIKLDYNALIAFLKGKNNAKANTKVHLTLVEGNKEIDISLFGAYFINSDDILLMKSLPGICKLLYQ